MVTEFNFQFYKCKKGINTDSKFMGFHTVKTVFFNTDTHHIWTRFAHLAGQNFKPKLITIAYNRLSF